MMLNDDSSLENLEQTPEQLQTLSSSINISSPSPSPSPSTSVVNPNNRHWKKWNKFTDRWCLLIIAFFIGIIWPFGLYSFPLFLQNTDSSSESLSGTPSYDAEKIYETAYGEINTTSMIVLLEQQSKFNESMIDGNSELYNDTKVFIENYRTFLKGLDHVESVVVVSYYDLEEADMTTVAMASFVAKNGTVQIFVIDYDIDEKTNVNDFLDDVIDWGDEHVPSALDIGYTGNDLFQKDIAEKTVNDMTLLIFVSVPLALIIVGVITKRIAVLIVPTMVILTATTLSSLLMWPVAAHGPQVSQYTPLAMLAVIISFSMDYCLFLLSRTVRGLDRHGEEMAIELALENAGHSILVSGVTMVLCFLFEMILPVSILATMGLGAALATFSCLLVTLTLVPSLLHTRFGKLLLSLTNEKLFNLLTSFYRKCCQRCGCGKTETTAAADDDDDHSVEISTKQDDESHVEWLGYPIQDSTTMPLLTTASDNTKKQQVETSPSTDTTTRPSPKTTNIWFELGMKITCYPTNHIIMTLFLAIFILPTSIFVPQLSTSISYDYYLSSDDPSEKTFRALGDDFSAGMPLPYKLIFDGSDHDRDVTTKESFDVMNHVVKRLTDDGVSDDVAPLTSYTGISTVGGSFIPHRFYEEAMECGMDCRIDARKSLYILNQGVTTSDNTTTYASVILNVDPLSKEGTDWLSNSRNIIDDLDEEGVLENYNVVIYGDAGIDYDNAEECYDVFPIVIVISTTIVIILMGLFYRSVAVAIASIVAISSTILFSLGFSILVYQYGILDWLGIKALSSSMASDEDDGEIVYIDPILSFSWFVGLVLNHYVFLIDRVWEYRREGNDDKSAVLLGSQDTGWILTGAGIITTVAFGVFLLSEMPIMNQFGCMTVAAVFINFMVMKLVVPILLGSYTAGFTWWPRQVPQGNSKVIAD